MVPDQSRAARLRQRQGHDLGQNPTNSLLALFPGGLILVPALISYYNGVKRVQAAAGLTGKEPPNGWIALALYVLLAPALWAYLQVSLNEVWAYESGNAARDASSPTEARFQNSRYRARSARDGFDRRSECGEGEGAAD